MSSCPQAQTEAGGGLAVTWKAEGAEVVEVALASAFSDREDVVGVPEGAAGVDGSHAVEGEAGFAVWASGSLQGVVDGNCVGLAEGADASVAGEDLVAEVAGVGAEAPLVDAVVGTEGAAALVEDFEVAPAAERKIVRAEQKGGSVETAAGHGAG